MDYIPLGSSKKNGKRLAIFKNNETPQPCKKSRRTSRVTDTRLLHRIKEASVYMFI